MDVALDPLPQNRRSSVDLAARDSDARRILRSDVIVNSSPKPATPPAPVLSIGFTGHRSIAGNKVVGAAVSQAVGSLLDALQVAANRAAALNHAAPVIDKSGASGRGEPAQLRLVSMLAEGADLLATGEAMKRRIDVAAILPGPVAAYRASASFRQAGSRARFDAALAVTTSVLELPSIVIDDLAFERANDLILAQSDLLIAVWDGKPARGRAGTGDVVQAALDRQVPVLVVEAAERATVALIADADKLLLPRRAPDLPRLPIEPVSLDALVASILRAPPRTTQRRALSDFFTEPATLRSWRRGHRLLTMLGGRCGAYGGYARPWSSNVVPPASGGQIGDVQRIEAEYDRADRLANHYGELMRSTLVLRFPIIALSAIANVVVTLSLPEVYQPFSAIAQVVITALVLLDERRAGQRRWHERWLDYRSLAERLRCLRYLHALGIGDEIFRGAPRGQPPHWTDWYLARLVRELGPPTATMGPAQLTAQFAFVREAMSVQLAYHKRVLKRLARIDRRLGWVATVSLLAVVVAGAIGVVQLLPPLRPLLTTTPLLRPWLESLPPVRHWLPALSPAVAIMTLANTLAAAFAGLRGAADLARLAQRSAFTAVALGRLGRNLDVVQPRGATAIQYDRLVAAARLITSVLVHEVIEWRFVVESRRQGRLRLPRIARRQRRRYQVDAPRSQ